MSDDRLRRLAWLSLAFTMFVVLFGAVVRATGSGAGCGSDWPTCRGGVVPLTGTAETVIEFTHRASSGIAFLLVVALVVLVMRARSKGDPVRTAAFTAGALMVVEAVVGMALVRFGWVEDDQSNGRAISIAVHLVITFLLLASLVLTAWWLGDGSRIRRPLPRRERRLFGWMAVGLIFVGAAGAITALGDTLFPAESILAGIQDDFTGAFLVRLRWIHPLVAVVVGVGAAWLAPRYAAPGTRAGRMALVVIWTVVAQLVLGFVNMVLLAPVWMQVVHLLAADVLWVVFVVFAVEAIAAVQHPPAEAVE